MVQPVGQHAMKDALSYWESDTYKPRKFATTWWLTPRVSQGMTITSPYFSVQTYNHGIAKSTYEDLSRYTSPRLLVNEIKRLGCTV